MSVTTEELNAVKAFMRIDGSDDDAVVEVCYGAAQEYLANAGVDLNLDKPLHKLAVWGLTLHYYDHRDAIGTEAAIPTNLRPIINQLKAGTEHYPV